MLARVGISLGWYWSADSRVTPHVQTSEAGAHRVWDGTILVANESRTWWPATCDKRPSTSDRGIFFFSRVDHSAADGIMSDGSYIPATKVDWTSTSAFAQFQLWRKEVERIIGGPLANKSNPVKVNQFFFLSGPVPMWNLLSRRRRTRIHRSTSRPRLISLISYRVVLRTALSFERCAATFATSETDYSSPTSCRHFFEPRTILLWGWPVRLTVIVSRHRDHASLKYMPPPPPSHSTSKVRRLRRQAKLIPVPWCHVCPYRWYHNLGSHQAIWHQATPSFEASREPTLWTAERWKQT